MKTFTTKPKVIMTEEVAEDIQIIVDKVNDEVGWYCCVKKLENGNYLLYKTIVPEQEVNGATCEITAAGQAKIMMDMINKGQEEVFNDMKFWGHSHVNMGVFASGQDDVQIMEFCKNTDDFFIRGIFNKKGEFRIDIYNVVDKIIVKDAKIEIVKTPDDSREKFWEEVIKANVKKLSYTPPAYKSGYNGDDWYYGKGYQKTTPSESGTGNTANQKTTETGSTNTKHGLYGSTEHDTESSSWAVRAAERAKARQELEKKAQEGKPSGLATVEIDKFGYVVEMPVKVQIYERRPEVKSIVNHPNGVKLEYGFYKGKEICLNEYIFRLTSEGKYFSAEELKPQHEALISRKPTQEEITRMIMDN